MASKDHPYNLDHEELEETISLCDLPISSDDQNYTTTTFEASMKDDESFEFFSQEWLKTNKDLNFFPSKETLFGRNPILPQHPISRNTQEFKKHDLGTSKVDLDSSLMLMNKGRNHGGKHESKRVFPASTSLKSRWYYYGFGLARIPAEMDLSAIKRRQNRHRKNHSVSGQGGGAMAESGGFWQGKGLGRLIRELSCDGETQANSMVKASLVYIPRV